VRWLFIIGVAFDLAGAAVIAWPMFYARRGELREEGTARWGRNTWVIVARTREQRFVRLGVLLLGIGFLLQLGAYVALLDSGSEVALAVLVVLALVTVSVLLAVRLANRGLPRYRDSATTGSVIEDVRDIYQVADLDDVPTFWRISVGRALTRSGQTLDAYVSDGRWVADCPCRGGIVASREMAEAACLDCGTVYAIRFPENAGEIEAVLLARPRKENQNWRPGETLADLRSENRNHGIPLFVGGAVSERAPAPPG
jgi:hypothetical protein